ncbi:MAG TPA: hypothetical protein VFZ79_11060 [Acidimicrobiales bacterium]
MALAAAACGGGDDAPADDTRGTTTVETTTTTQLTPEEEAEAVYLEFVDTVNRLGQTQPDPDDPQLGRLAKDPVLSSVQDSFTTLRSENQIWQLGESTSNHVMSVEVQGSSLAILYDCVVENDILIDRDDGSVVRAQPLTTRLLMVTLVPTEAGWAVGSIETVQKFDGDVPCDDG